MTKIFTSTLLGLALALSAPSAVAETMDYVSTSPDTSATLVDGQTVMIEYPAAITLDEDLKWDVNFYEEGGWGSNYSPVYTTDGIYTQDQYLCLVFQPEGWTTNKARLELPEGLVKLTADPTVVNAAATIYFPAADAPTEVTVSIMSADYTASTLDEIPASFYMNIQPGTATRGPGAVKIVNDKNQQINVITIQLYGNTWEFVIPSDGIFGAPIVKKGTYTLICEEGAFVNGSTKSKAFEQVWNVTGANDDNPGTDPEPVGTLQPTGTVPAAGDIVLSSESPEFYMFSVRFNTTISANALQNVTMVNTSTGEQCAMECDVINNSSLSINALNITFTPALVYSGRYKLTIPAGAIAAADGSVNPELVYNFTITGGKEPIVSGGDPTLKSITPSSAEPLAGFMDGDVITVELNNPEGVAVVEGWLIDTTNYDYIFAMAQFVKQEDGTYQWTAGWNYTMYEGHDYELRLFCYDAPHSPQIQLGETIIVNYKGSSKNVNPVSPVQIVKIDPEPGSLFDSHSFEVSVTFSEEVSFVGGYATGGGQGAETSTLSGTPSNDGKTWTLAGTLGSAEVTLIVKFEDADGLNVVSNKDTRDLYDYYEGGKPLPTQFAMRYESIADAVTVDVDPASGSTVTSLKEFVFTNPHSSSLNQMYGIGSPNQLGVYNAAGERVAMGYQMYGDNETEANPMGTGASVTVVLNQEVTANGTYTVVVPREMFNLSGNVGTAVYADQYKGQTMTYTIGGNNTKYDLEYVAVTPEMSAEVTELSIVSFTFDQEVVIKEGMADEFYITDRTIGQYHGTLSVAEDGKTVNFILDEPITEEGQYVLVIAQGTIGDKQWGESTYLDGHANDIIYADWTVVPAQNETVYDLHDAGVEPPVEEALAELSTVILYFDEEVAIAEYMDWVVVEFGNPSEVTLGTMKVGEDGKSIIITMDEPLTEAGTYKMTIPEGAIGTKAWAEAGYMQGSAMGQHSISWAVDGSMSGIEAIGAEQGAIYYTIEGVKVANPQQGTLVIKVVGNKATKQIVK